jgi:L-lactate utilization protein LutC
VALLPIERLHEDLSHYLAARRAPGLEPAHLALLTGPSRSIDIELQTTRGTHGPAALHVILLR